MHIDPSLIVTVLGAILTGGIGKSLVDAALARWKIASGRRRTQAELVAALREALARARLLAIQAGVDPDDLPDDPTKTT